MHTDAMPRIPLDNFPVRLQKRTSSCGIPGAASLTSLANFLLKIALQLADPGSVLQYELCGSRGRKCGEEDDHSDQIWYFGMAGDCGR